MSLHEDITLLQYVLNQVITNYSRITERNALLPYTILIAKLLSSGNINCEQLIKGTMKFFNNSFFVTSYIIPSQQGIFSEIPIVNNLNDSLSYGDDLKHQRPGQSITLLFALCPENPEKIVLNDIIHNIADQLLNSCLKTLDESSPDEQNAIIDNLYQLTVIALKKGHLNECISFSKAVLFCCINHKNPSLEVHELFIKAITIFCSTYSRLFNGNESIKFLNLIKSLPVVYLNGLSDNVLAQLRVSKPAMLDKFKGIRAVVESEHNLSIAENTQKESSLLSEGPNMWSQVNQTSEANVTEHVQPSIEPGIKSKH